ncbi:MAG: class I fructose-bisphosphate aldolase [Myxococcota bacterium]
MSKAVERVLSNYAGEPPGVLGNLRRMLLHGALGGTGKMVILPVDQGFEHGPARSFQPNPHGYDPFYHPRMAVEAGCSAYAAPLGLMEVIASEFAGRLPLILKVNNSDGLGDPGAPCSALTSSAEDALRLGCSAVGFTIYPGSAMRNVMYEQTRDLIREARQAGLPTILWSYARGAMPKDGETAVDVIAYAAHIACELGAHIIKVKPPTDHVYQEAARKNYESIPHSTLEERVRHVVQSAFDGRRIVIFSGGPAKATEDVLDEVRAIAKGGGFGSIVGRNAFQRTPKEGAELLQSIMQIFKEHLD